ncbi:putative protein E6 [Helianthus annuus]|uniref:Protein E6 n=2 Tax=Helianthus annuus TaxID=4232 RepID=A0A9K3J9R0_HELAN|nr:putative protein E6 [Helianthus annuus]KAJ0932077.1 putative protein E6 [Helianthus annuus]
MNIKIQSQNSYLSSMALISYFILLTLTLSSTIHARESQFFNKFSNNNQQQPLNTNQEQPLNTNQQQQQQPLNTNQQEQPEFIPQTQDSDSYGLYGHESGQLPPSATTTTTNNNNNLPDYLPENYNPVAYTTPIHSNTQEYIPDEYKEYPQANKYNGESRMYNSEKQGFDFDDARFMETREGGGNVYNSEKQVEDQRYNSEMQGMGRYGTRGNGNMYNPEKQGMSDTRFLENGKYYYDINMENPNSNANMNMNMNTRGFGSRNGYNTQGYYGNNQNSYGSRNGYNTQGYYGNNQNSYDRYNYNGGYQNQEYRFNP